MFCSAAKMMIWNVQVASWMWRGKKNAFAMKRLMRKSGLKRPRKFNKDAWTMTAPRKVVIWVWPLFLLLLSKKRN